MVTPAPTSTGLKKKHLPAVGIIGLALIAVTLGGLYYSQFVVSHNTACTVASIHRVYIMNAIIQDVGGFQVQAIYQTNITGTIPTNSSGLPNIASANFTKLPPRTDSKEIYGNPGDMISIFIKATNSSNSLQYPGIPGHGFDFTDKSFLQNINVTGGTGTTAQPTPTVLKFDRWVNMSFQIGSQGSGGYFCTVTCSAKHGNMRGTLRAGCGG